MEVKSVWANAVPKEKLFDQSMGKLLGSKMIRYCQVPDASDFCKKFKVIDADANNDASMLMHGKGDDLTTIFSIDPAKFSENFLCKGYLPIVWVNSTYIYTFLLLITN